MAARQALDAALADCGGFDHNGHTVRIVTALETPYPGFDGLNLSWEALEGLAKHNGPVAAPRWALAEANPNGTSNLPAGRRSRRRSPRSPTTSPMTITTSTTGFAPGILGSTS